MGDRRLDVARAGPRLPAQPVAHDDPLRPGDGRAVRRARLLPRRRRDRGRGDARSAGRSCTGATGARSRSACRPALIEPGAGAGAGAADRPGADPRRAAHADRRDRQGAARRRGDGDAPRASTRSARCDGHRLRLERGAVRAVETTLGHDPDAAPSCSPPGSGGRRSRALAGVRLPLVPVLHQYAVTEPLPELAGETREVVHPILRHQDADLYFRQQGDAYGIGNYDHEPRLVEPWEIAAPGRPGQPSMLPFTPADFARAADGDGARCCPPSAGRRSRALRRADVVHARRDAADRRGRRRPRAVAVRGDLGHARRRRRPRARRADRARRRPHRPARVRPAALRRARAQPRLRRSCAARSSTARSTTSCTRASSRSRSGCCAARRCTRASSSSARTASRAPAGSGRSGSRPTRSSTPATCSRATPGRRATGRRSPPPSTARAASGSACSTSRRSPRSRSAARARSPSSRASPANDVDRPVGTIVYTAMCAPRGGIMCDLTITRTGRRDASSSSPAARSAATTSRG